MTTKPKQAEQNLIADARHVAAATRRHFAAIRAADAKRKKKLLEEKRLARFEASIDALAGATGGQALGRETQAKATVLEAERRDALYEALIEVRDEIKLTHDEEPAIGRAFNVGSRLARESTPKLLASAELVLASWNDPVYRKAAEEAGITAVHMRKIKRLRTALAAADTAQHQATTTGRGKTLSKAAMVRELKAETTYVRRVAGLVFRGQPSILAEFESTQVRHAVKPRATSTTKAAKKTSSPKRAARAASPPDDEPSSK